MLAADVAKATAAEPRPIGRLPPAVRLAMSAALVGGFCYLGNLFDATVRFPSIGTAIFYPPYAILTAALLLAPTQHWWLFLLASSLAHLLVHRFDRPVPWVVLLDTANLTRALVAAGGVRWFSAGPLRFDRLRGVMLFLLFPVILAPVAGALVGARIVTLAEGTGDYRLLWQAWALSNALTALILLPIIMIGIARLGTWKRRATPGRLYEAGLLSAGLLAVSVVAFGEPDVGLSTLAVRLYAPLPFLLWAAVRFGTEGIALSLLAVTGLTIGGAAYGTGPFVTQSPTRNVLSLELFLMGISVPLLILAALIEERQQQETALHEAHTELARVSRVLTVGQLAASISHEVNQPLCALAANAAACRRWLNSAEPDLQEAREAADEIVRDATRANEVLVRIRTLLKKDAVEHSELNLGVVVRGVVTLLNGEARARGVSLHMDMADALPSVLGDHVQLEQVLLNLILNGMDATIGVVDRPREVRVGSSVREPGWVEITVRDTGVGFGPDEQERLFEPFYSTKAQGMGLGLSITRTIVDGHGGHLWAERNEEHGATFHVALPARRKVGTLVDDRYGRAASS
jgi:signal transduction histidine kinase